MAIGIRGAEVPTDEKVEMVCMKMPGESYTVWRVKEASQSVALQSPFEVVEA